MSPDRCRILMVDDEPNILAGYRRVLGTRYTLVTAIGPEAGLALIQAGPPFEIIVSDMRMPGMDGLTFLNEARRATPASMLMILTGNSEVPPVGDHIFRYLSKPCAPEDLERAFQDAIAHRGAKLAG